MDDPRGVMAEHADKLRDILARLDAVQTVAIWMCLASGCTLSKAGRRVFGR
jgi:hypothetical protein